MHNIKYIYLPTYLPTYLSIYLGTYDSWPKLSICRIGQT